MDSDDRELDKILQPWGENFSVCCFDVLVVALEQAPVFIPLLKEMWSSLTVILFFSSWDDPSDFLNDLHFPVSYTTAKSSLCQLE